MGQFSFRGFPGLPPTSLGGLSSLPPQPGLCARQASTLLNRSTLHPPALTPPKTSAHLNKALLPTALPCPLSGLEACSVTQAADSRSEVPVSCPPPSRITPSYTRYYLLDVVSSLSQTAWPWSRRYQDSVFSRSSREGPCVHKSLHAPVRWSGQGRHQQRIHTVQSLWCHDLKVPAHKGTSSESFLSPNACTGWDFGLGPGIEKLLHSFMAALP